MFRSLPSFFNLSLSESCLHTMHFDELVGWKPTCEIDGTYMAKQCRGDKMTGRFVFLCLFYGLRNNRHRLQVAASLEMEIFHTSPT